MPRVAGPAQDTGYFSGNPPRAGGTGSKRGPRGLSNMTGDTPSDWHPTVKYLLVLVIAEIALMGVMRYFTKHGG